MKIERVDNEVIFRVSGDINLEDLQDIFDLLEFRVVASGSKASQKDVDKLVKTVKKGRWKETKNRLGL
jgi:hypothetical protein